MTSSISFYQRGPKIWSWWQTQNSMSERMVIVRSQVSDLVRCHFLQSTGTWPEPMQALHTVHSPPASALGMAVPVDLRWSPSLSMIALTASGLSSSYLRLNGWDWKTTSLWLRYIMIPLIIFKYISSKCAVMRWISVPCMDRHQESWAFHCPPCASMHEVIAWLRNSATSWPSESSSNSLASPDPCILPLTWHCFA